MARRTLYCRRQPNKKKYIYIREREMDGCLVDCIAAHGARAVQVFHGNDYEHWQTGKCFHTHTRSPPYSSASLLSFTSSITPDTL